MSRIMTERKTKRRKNRKTRNKKTKKTKKVRGGKSKKSLGWEKKVENVITNKSKETHYSYLCKYFYKNEDDKRTYDTHLITTDDPEFEGDDKYLADAIAKENDKEKRKRLMKIQASKEKFVESIQKRIANILKEREEEKARKAGEEADLNALVEGKKAKKADEQELNQQLDIASKNAEVQKQKAEELLRKREVEREAEEKAEREAEEKARREAEAEEKARRETEEKAKAKQNFKNIIEKQIITNETKKNLKKATENTIKQAEEAKQKRETREREAAEKQNIINNGLFGEYETTDGKTKYFLINPYDLDAKCDPKDNKDDDDFIDPVIKSDLNGSNIIQIGKHCYNINSVIKGFNTRSVNSNFPSRMGLNRINYNKADEPKSLKSIIGKTDWFNTPYTVRDVKYLANFITKLLEKGEDPFAPPE